jgi:hypothetical protein
MQQWPRYTKICLPGTHTPEGGGERYDIHDYANKSYNSNPCKVLPKKRTAWEEAGLTGRGEEVMQQRGAIQMGVGDKGLQEGSRAHEKSLWVRKRKMPKERDIRGPCRP